MLEDGLAVASQEDDAAELAAGGAFVEPGGERGQLDAHAVPPPEPVRAK